MACEWWCESLVVPSWSRPVKNVVGSASEIKQDIPPPEATGFSCSVTLLLDAADNARFLLDLSAVSIPRLSSDGLDMLASPGTTAVGIIGLCCIRAAALPPSKAGSCGVVGDVDCGVAAEDDEAVEDVEKDEKTEPNTRFAFSREASFPTSMLSREGFLRCFGGGWGRNS